MDKPPDTLVQGGAASNDNARANGSLGMKSFEILQVTVKKWVFVVPFDLKGERVTVKSLDMINLVRGGLPWGAVNSLSYDEHMLLPT